MKKFNLIILGMLLITMAGGIYLVGKVADTRKGAAYAGVSVGFIPNTKTLSVGETLTATMIINSNQEKLSGVDINIRYDKSKLRVLSSRIVTTQTPGIGENNALFINESDVLTLTKNESENSGYINLAGISMEEDVTKMASGVVQLLKIDLEAIAAGEAHLGLWQQDSNTIVGHNVNGNDKGLSITDYSEGIYLINEPIVPTLTPTPTAGTGSGPRLRFRLTFSGVEPNAECVTNWPLSVIVLGNGKTAVYNVIAQKMTEVTDRAVFLADLRPEGFETAGTVALFIKGPKHIQMKYGKDGQNSPYGMAGGQILLTDEDKTYDFSNYPLLAGDVTGPGGGRDGLINVLDFSLVKTKAGTHQTVAETDYLLEDLDGNCQLAPQDVEVLKQSLSGKQDELY